jgi:serine/threonine protein kinase
MSLNLARLGPFVLEEVIGSGGMGEVWRGMHQARAMPVAVKILRGEIARKPAYRRAFSSEVRAVAGCSTPTSSRCLITARSARPRLKAS